MNAVVNRDDRRAADGRRHDVMRRMKDIRSLSVEHPRDVKLLANGVVFRRFKHRPEILAELGAYAEIRLMTEKDVFVVAIDTGEMPQQVSGIGADAEIVQFPRIDCDSHACIIPS
jgi:hypothetical protein